MAGESLVFKFQYDNTLSWVILDWISEAATFKFQYDNTLSLNKKLEKEKDELI